MSIKIYEQKYNTKKICGKSLKINREMQKNIIKDGKNYIKLRTGKEKINVLVHNPVYRNHKLGEFISCKMMGPKIQDKKRREKKKLFKKKENKFKLMLEKARSKIKK